MSNYHTTLRGLPGRYRDQSGHLGDLNLDSIKVWIETKVIGHTWHHVDYNFISGV